VQIRQLLQKIGGVAKEQRSASALADRTVHRRRSRLPARPKAWPPPAVPAVAVAVASAAPTGRNLRSLQSNAADASVEEGSAPHELI